MIEWLKGCYQLHFEVESTFVFITMKDIKIMKGREFGDLSNKVIGCAIEVHKILGPGLLESTYQQCLAHELSINQIEFKIEYPWPVNYKGIRLDCGYRIDLLVEEKIILELKSVEQLKGIHEAQLLTYMKLADIKQGFLINFNVKLLKQGLKSFVL
jgi:GxxExxY protein